MRRGVILTARTFVSEANLLRVAPWRSCAPSWKEFRRLSSMSSSVASLVWRVIAPVRRRVVISAGWSMAR